MLTNMFANLLDGGISPRAHASDALTPVALVEALHLALESPR